jgi:hypothetical protein
MTTLTMRMIKGDFVVTGPDVELMKFTCRRKSRDWCKTKYPGSPIHEIGADASRRVVAVLRGGGRVSASKTGRGGVGSDELERARDGC